jgi:TonB family protein
MRVIACVVAGALLMPGAASGQAEDALMPIRELYESASYEAALAALDSMSGTGHQRAIEAEQYRVFCLVALGRSSEAEHAIERIVMADPMFAPAEAETSPRILAAFANVRRRALPAVVSELYDQGKVAFDRRQFDEAERALASAVNLIDTPEVVNRPGMDDLRRLASGFLALSRAELAAAKPAVVEPLEARATIAAPAATVAVETAPSTTEPAPASAETASAGPAAVPVPTTIVRPDTEPIALRQDLPPWTNPAAGFEVVYRGAILVNIDEQGDVTGAEIVESIYPHYNQELMRFARRWKYEPAQRDGRPVRSQKRVEVQLMPR